jgi:hypothetical protein
MSLGRSKWLWLYDCGPLTEPIIGVGAKATQLARVTTSSNRSTGDRRCTVLDDNRRAPPIATALKAETQRLKSMIANVEALIAGRQTEFRAVVDRGRWNS